jgi:hypothetical protein
MPEPSAFQRSFADFCVATAQWRRRKADEYDRDERNLRTADALQELGNFVVSLPPDDLRLRDLQRLTGSGEDFTPDQRVLYEMGRFRFFQPDASMDAFLTHLVALAEADRGEAGRFGGLMPAGDDPWA